MEFRLLVLSREKPEILSLDLNRFMLQKSVVEYASKYTVLHFLWLKLICCTLFPHCFARVTILFFDTNNLTK